MITTKKELTYYLEQDAIALHRQQAKRPKLMGDELWKFQIVLRKAEYYTNTYVTNKKK